MRRWCKVSDEIWCQSQAFKLKKRKSKRGFRNRYYYYYFCLKLFLLFKENVKVGE